MDGAFTHGAVLMQKAWYESRTRFFLCAAVVGILCAAFVLFQGPMRGQLHGSTMPDASYVGHIYRRVYGGFVRGLFLFQAMILGLGGLQRERAHGTVGFTLALPVGRFHHVAARALTGLLEIVILAWIPAILVPALSILAGQSYSWMQSAEFAVLWTLIGTMVFVFALLASTNFRGEFTALTTVLLAYYVYPLVVVRMPILRGRPLHIHYIMNGTGMPYFDPKTDLLIGPISGSIIAGCAATTLAVFILAAWVTKREDFS